MTKCGLRNSLLVAPKTAQALREGLDVRSVVILPAAHQPEVEEPPVGVASSVMLPQRNAHAAGEAETRMDVTEPQGVSIGAAKHTRPKRNRGPIRGKKRGPYKKKITATADTTSSNSQQPALPRRNVVCSMPPCPSIIRTTTTTANSNDNARMETIKAAREHALAPAAVESNFKASDLKSESPTLSASAAATSAIDKVANILQLLQTETELHEKTRKEHQHERKMLQAKLAMLVKAKSKTKEGVLKIPLTEEQQKINHNKSSSKSYYERKKDSNNHDSDVAVSNDNDDSGDALLFEEHPTEKKYGTTSIGKEETQQNWNTTAMLEEPMDADATTTTTTTTGTAAKPVTSKPKASSNKFCCGTGENPNNIGTFPSEEGDYSADGRHGNTITTNSNTNQFAP